MGTSDIGGFEGNGWHVRDRKPDNILEENYIT